MMLLYRIQVPTLSRGSRLAVGISIATVLVRSRGCRCVVGGLWACQGTRDRQNFPTPTYSVTRPSDDVLRELGVLLFIDVMVEQPIVQNIHAMCK